MAVDLRCPNCKENLGKDIENPRKAYCSTCGTSFDNPRGYKMKSSQKTVMGVVNNFAKNKGSKRCILCGRPTISNLYLLCDECYQRKLN